MCRGDTLPQIVFLSLGGHWGHFSPIPVTHGCNNSSFSVTNMELPIGSQKLSLEASHLPGRKDSLLPIIALTTQRKPTQTCQRQH
jgi:hypothetical protein